MSFVRHLEIDGTFNLRDAGYYTTQDGRVVQPGRLFRAGALHDLHALSPLHVRTVLDLRSDAEIERDGIVCGPLSVPDDIRRISLSLIPQNVDGLGVSAYLDSLVGPGISAERYLKYFEIAGDAIRSAIEVFGAPDAFPAVVHCTAGKDRTGVIVALLLDIVGVPHETIVEDYALSSEALPQLVQHLRAVGRIDHEPSESDLIRYGAPPKAMDGMLRGLRQEYGSARAYLRSRGVADAVFTAIERALLAP